MSAAINTPLANERLQSIASIAQGQRLVIIAILVGIISYVGVAIHPILGIIFLGALVFQFVSVAMLASALGYRWFGIFMVVILMIIPIVSLIILAWLSQKATNKLRAAGLRVGFLGVSQQKVEQLQSPSIGGNEAVS